MIRISKTKIILPHDGDDVKSFLTFNDKSVGFQISKLKQNFMFAKGDPEKFKARLDDLKSQQNKCLLFYDVEGNAWTYSGLAQDLTKRFGWDLVIQDVSPTTEKHSFPWIKMPPPARYYQNEAFEELIKNTLGAIELPTGCHAAGTKILMFDGTLKSVEDIAVGGLLMGPDSQPRKVKELHNGRQEMAKITPIKGDSFIVNIDHILSLQKTNTKKNYRENIKNIKHPAFKGLNPVVNISVRNYLNQSKTFKHNHKLYRTGVEFQDKKENLPIPSYILGLWLGDGSSDVAALTSMDDELVKEWSRWVNDEGIDLSVRSKNNNKASTYSAIIPGGYKNIKNKGPGVFINKCTAKLRELDILNNKHIPLEYKVSSRENRLELLAGLIDSDGHNATGCYDYVSISSKLSNDVAYLARSLGFNVTIRKVRKGCQTGAVGEYYRLSISGDLSSVPVRLERKKIHKRKQIKNVLRTGFTVNLIPEDNYYGFEVDQDNLYLMGDFTVTHNSGKSMIILKLLKHFGIKSLIITPFSNITNQLRVDLEESFGVKYVGQYGDGKKKTEKLFTVATAQSVSRIQKNTKEWDNLSKCGMVIFDESHLVAAESFKAILLDGVAATIEHRYFLSATQTRTDGSEMLLKGITGPVVYRKEYKELADQGFLKKINVKFFNINPCRPPNNDPKKETRSNLYKNPSVAKFAAELAEKAWKVAGRQTVILIEEYEQFLLLKNFLTVPYEFAHGTMNKETKESVPKKYWDCDVNSIVDQFNKGNLPILIGTTAIATGVDIRPTGCIIYLQGGTSEIKVKQSIGRGTRPVAHPDLWVIDFNIVGSPILERHARVRSEIYKTLTDNEVSFIGS